MVWITNVSMPFAPPSMTYGISKADSDPAIARMKLRPMTGLIPGTMM